MQMERQLYVALKQTDNTPFLPPSLGACFSLSMDVSNIMCTFIYKRLEVSGTRVDLVEDAVR